MDRRHFLAIAAASVLPLPALAAVEPKPSFWWIIRFRKEDGAYASLNGLSHSVDEAHEEAYMAAIRESGIFLDYLQLVELNHRNQPMMSTS